MSTERRMHPMKIVQSLIQMIKNSFIVIIYLFIIKWGDESSIFFYLRLAFILFIIAYFLAVITEWVKTRYLFSGQTIQIRRGLFKKKQQEIRLVNIHNIHRETPFYLKVFGVTSLTLNTKGTDNNASLTFEALKLAEVERIEQLLADHRQLNMKQTSSIDNPEHLLTVDEAVPSEQLAGTEKTIHFRPTKKDLFKASFLSLSFLIIIPVILTVIERLKDIINIAQYTEGLLQFIKYSWFTIVLTAVTLILIAIVIGIIKTYLTYGKYEIASDDARIYIRSGLLNEKVVSIRKENVQGIRVHQSLLKRWLRMTEIMLISTGGEADDLEDIQSLFPYLPTKQAFKLTQVLLPAFRMQDSLHRLPRQALLMKMLRIPWVFCIIATVLLILKPTWWFILPILFLLTYVIRYFDYRNTYYKVDTDDIQFTSGGIDSVSFITTRKHMIEVAVKQSIIQKRLGLATLITYTQATPVHEETIKDIPIEMATQYIHWYCGRFETLVVE